MKYSRFFSLIGMAGVTGHESATAKVWERRFDLALIPVALLTLITWYDSKQTHFIMSETLHLLGDWTLWLFFVSELVIMSSLVTNRWRYIRNNWFNLLIIVSAMPLLWHEKEIGTLRILRFILIAIKLTHLSHTLRQLLSRNHLGITVIVCWVFTAAAGVLMAAIDPAIHSISDGIWWAWVTVTTVGYGDIVPISGAGRILAGILMLVGMGLFAVFTANISALLVAREEVKIIAKEKDVLEMESEVLKGEEKILHYLHNIDQRLKNLEENIGKNQ